MAFFFSRIFFRISLFIKENKLHPRENAVRNQFFFFNFFLNRKSNPNPNAVLAFTLILSLYPWDSNINSKKNGKRASKNHLTSACDEKMGQQKHL